MNDQENLEKKKVSRRHGSSWASKPGRAKGLRAEAFASGYLETPREETPVSADTQTDPDPKEAKKVGYYTRKPGALQGLMAEAYSTGYLKSADDETSPGQADGEGAVTQSHEPVED